MGRDPHGLGGQDRGRYPGRLRGHGGTTAQSHEAARDVIGLGLIEAMARLWPKADDAALSRAAARYRFHYLNADATPLALFSGARELVDWLLQRDYLLAVATGKSRRGFDLTLDDTGLADRFHATRCADETYSKPHPKMLLQLMDELGVTGAETLMVGDTEYDMQMAHNAGASALAVCHGVHERERLLAQGPLDCLETLPELRSWLERSEAV